MKNEITYIRKGDYLYPALVYTTSDRPIGIWGIRRKDYLKEHRPGLYTELLLTGKIAVDWFSVLWLKYVMWI